jgi:hypothetical protein
MDITNGNLNAAIEECVCLLAGFLLFRLLFLELAEMAIGMLYRENSVDGKDKPPTESIQFDRQEARPLLPLKLIRRLFLCMSRVSILVLRMFGVMLRMILTVVAIMMTSSNSSIGHHKGCGNHRTCGVDSHTDHRAYAPVSDSANINLIINFGHFIGFLRIILLSLLGRREPLQ